ncbi:type IV secretory system conjugative DNA transfer family protein [Halocatena halophila]|uniref:type IV secretory system conjugative DNA transfer family protein n=1 Tax=Halocatena halophila TaxID=2814576 RepID=UPI002ED186D3
MVFDRFRSDKEDTACSTQSPEEAETSIAGDTYEIEAMDIVREQGVEIGVEAPSDDPERDVDRYASPRIRRIIEDGYDDPTSSIWVGYDITARQGFTATGIPFEDLFQHQLIVGTTGTGKTNQMLTQMLQLAYAGWGFIYFDPKAEDSRELLKRLPEHRLEDVVWIEPGDATFERSVQINFLDVPECENETELASVIEDRLQVIKSIFDNDDYWGPRMNAIVETMSRAMMHHNHAVDDPAEKYSIIDFYFILLKEERREAFAKEIDDPFLQEFLRQIAEMNDDELRPVMTRVKSWVENGVMRKIIAARESSISFPSLPRENKIVIVRTPVASDDAKQMVTLGTFRPTWTAIQTNSFEGEREPFFGYMDEADTVLSDNLQLDDILARARSMKFGMTLACQHPHQLKESGVLKSVLNNCNNLLAFRVLEDDDARPLMDRFRGYGTEDLLNTENYHIWTKLPIPSGGYSEPLKLKTFAPYPPLRSDGDVDEVIRESLNRYGAEPLTDAEIQQSLHFGELTEALDEPASLDMSEDHSRNQALKAIYDESIRNGDPGGFVAVETVLDRLQTYLPGGESITDTGKAWRSVLQKIPDDYLGDRTNSDDEREVKALDTGFMNIGETQNDGGAGHGELLADAYTPLTQLGFRMTVPEQTGDAMPDGLAAVDDALDLGGVSDPDEIAARVAEYREEQPLLSRLAGAKDAYIEAECSTAREQPSQTIINLVQAHAEGHRCLFIARATAAERVYNTVGREPLCCRSGHSVDGERRFYTGTGSLTIAGEKMTRPGKSDNVWVHDEASGQYILRDTDGVEYARFDRPEEIYTDASKYPSDGERNIKPPVIPEFEIGDPEDAEWDIIVVPVAPRDDDGKKELLAPEELTLYRDGASNVPLPDIVDTDPATSDPEKDDLRGGVQQLYAED